MVTSMLEQTTETLFTTLLPVGESAAIPWALHPAWFIILALTVPALAWLGFAWKRALEADPSRPRRHGLRDLKRLLDHARSEPLGCPQPAQLHRWLQATARIWGVPVAAPTAEQIVTALKASSSGNAPTARWHALWQEAEHALYAAEGTVSAQWLERAAQAAAEIERPPRLCWWPNRLSHWLPPLASAALLALGIGITLGPAGADAEEAPTAAGAGLEAADQLAGRALDADWTDWAAHQSLAVVHLGEGHWHRAVAHAATAFVLHPSSREVAEVLRFALQQTDSADRTLRRLALGTGYERFPARMSAAAWQRLSLFAALLLAAGLSILVISMYARGRMLIHAGTATAAAGAIVMALSVVCFHAYGNLARPDAAMVLMPANALPIPTELAPEEHIVPLPPGTVVETQRRFLGWQQVVSRDGSQGWVRRQSVLPFYRPST